MRWSTLPPLLVAAALLVTAATQYPQSGAAYAMGAAGLIILGCWLTLEIGSEVATRWQQQRDRSDTRAKRVLQDSVDIITDQDQAS